MEGQIDGLIQQVVKDIREVVGQRRGTGKTPGVSCMISMGASATRIHVAVTLVCPDRMARFHLPVLLKSCPPPLIAVLPPQLDARTTIHEHQFDPRTPFLRFMHG